MNIITQHVLAVQEMENFSSQNRQLVLKNSISHNANGDRHFSVVHDG